jgi:mono/diheme cytochrome c family protein
VKRSSQIVAGAVVVLALAVLVVVLVAGGDDDDTTPPPAGVEASGGDQEAIGLFTDACGQCHTLTVAGTTGDVGPDLDDEAFDEERVLNAIQNGAGGGAMAPGLLEGAEAEAVAKLIATDEPTLANAATRRPDRRRAGCARPGEGPCQHGWGSFRTRAPPRIQSADAAGSRPSGPGGRPADFLPQSGPLPHPIG